MEPADQPQPPLTRTPWISAEAIIGSGITVAALGVLALLLGWAEWMRLERGTSLVWLLVGAVFVAVGATAAVFGHARRPQA